MARIRVINDCLCHRTQKYWSTEELAEKILQDADITISTRSIVGDINHMKTNTQLGYAAPIKHSKLHNGYYYTDPEYSIDKLPLNAADIKALKLAASTLNQYRNIPLLNAFTNTIDKVIKFSKRSDQSAVFNFIDFEKTPFALGMEFMDTIIEAIQEKKCLLINYQRFGDDAPNQYDFHPYLLKEYRNRWYVIGLNEQKNALRTYGLDRIIDLTKSDCSYKENMLVDKNYLADCVGINIADRKVETVKLKFVQSEGYYLKTQSMHHSQAILQDNEDGLIIELKVIINFELIGIILGYGALVTVLEPENLVNKIQEIANKIIINYPAARK